ncbi:hypothetical protein Rrhod_3421 [Rhodococcus rhodnii LMG 5362]|uniref:Uncharacterized protein n=1 Tax=Rhodococcus rhodnii LMG 5362 TaxID=1273125 RepID=R7WJ52_9NOCA|nr:hypothetical protein Rrhod_3421 [Rhodococcus rhodnii LMG 5362]
MVVKTLRPAIPPVNPNDAHTVPLLLCTVNRLGHFAEPVTRGVTG